MPIVKVYVAPVYFMVGRCHQMKKRLIEEASHVIAVEGIHRLGESLFLEVGMSTTGSLPLMKRGVLRRPSS